MPTEAPTRRPSHRLVPAVLIVAMVVAAAGGYLHFRAAVTRMDRVRALASETEQVRRDTRAAVLADDHVMRQELRQMASRIPAGGDVSDLLTDLSVALADGEVTQREVVTQPTVSGRPFSRVPLSLRLTCSFEQAFKLLARIEGTRRLTRIDRLTITGPADDRSSPLRVEIDVSTFARDAEETATWAALQ